MPAPASRSRAHASSSSPSVPAHSRSPISRIVGRSPSAARPEATSTPMNPPPITVTRAPAPASMARDRRRRASSRLRRRSADSPPSRANRRGPRAGRDQAALEPDPCAVVEGRLARVQVERHDALPGEEIDAPCARTNARARRGRGRREDRPGGAPCSAAGGCRAGSALRRPARSGRRIPADEASARIEPMRPRRR